MKNIFYAKLGCNNCHGKGVVYVRSGLGYDEIECDCWQDDAIEEGYSAEIDDGDYEVHPHPSLEGE